MPEISRQNWSHATTFVNALGAPPPSALARALRSLGPQAEFPEFGSEPFKSSLSAEEEWGWLLRAAQAGSVQGQYSAGAALATGDWGDGHVVPIDLEGAVGWYRRAAEAGHAEAQFNLATMLMEGEGCDRDPVAARDWLNRSLAGGYTYAREPLADVDFWNRGE